MPIAALITGALAGGGELLGGLFGGLDALAGGIGALGAGGAAAEGALGAGAAEGALGAGAAAGTSLGLDASLLTPEALGAFAGPTEGGFGALAGPTQAAIASGVFDPVGANFTTFGAADTGLGAATGVAGGAPAIADPTINTLASGSTTGPLSWLEGTQAGGAPGTLPTSFPGAAGGGIGDILGSAGSFIGKYPGVVPAAGLLGYDIWKGQQQDANIKAMTGQAGSLGATGQQLMSYLTKGTLPPGLQTAVQNATNAMKARIISNAAANGQSTDPKQNSALAQELNQVDLNAVALIAQQGEALMQQGLEASQLSGNLYAMLEKFQVQQNQQVGQAISTFASALAPRGTTINIGGTKAA